MASGLSSTGFAENYDRAVRMTLKSADIVGGEDPNTVNILGYEIQDLGWTYGRDELRALLTAMGVGGNAFIGCRSGRPEVLDSSAAALNVMIHPEYYGKASEIYGGALVSPSCACRRAPPSDTGPRARS